MAAPHSSVPLTDTSPEVRSAQVQRYRAMTIQRKLEMVEDANATARILALTGLATRHPRASAGELHLRLFHLIHGSEVAARAWSPLPEDPSG